jgi:hypothetical protein
MSAFWNNTPYTAWGIHIGGEDRACGQPNLTSSWVSEVTAQGWHLLTFSDARNGLAETTQNSCTGKKHCRATVKLYRTSDGGRTWAPVTG